MIKASLPQGTRDFGPETVRKRNHILDTIRSVFELHGFQPLETPAMENLETLMGKYGEEGDKLIFKILNNGLGDPKNIEKAKIAFKQVLEGKNDKHLTERALRYDLTIPFARWVAMHHGELVFPFKRYQIQPVWRADRPQKGRYREFFQCDADIVGSNSMLNEVELAGIYARAFELLKMGVDIKINNRKILAALAEFCGGSKKMNAIAISIDKLDKIGIESVKKELKEKDFEKSQIELIGNYLSIQGTNQEKLEKIKSLLGNNDHGKQGISEIEFLLAHCGKLGINCSFDPTLARGLNYYTGTIFEVKTLKADIGSVGGGGRYDDLTGLFGVPSTPGVGISFGVDRIYDAMEELSLFPTGVSISSNILFFNLGEKEELVALNWMKQLRNKGIACELYHEKAKFDKQFKYAEKKHIPYVAIIGEKELESETCNLKDLRSGEQKNLSLQQLLASF